MVKKEVVKYNLDRGMRGGMIEMIDTNGTTGTVMIGRDDMMAIGIGTETGISGNTTIVTEVMIEIEVEKGDINIATGTVIEDKNINVQDIN